MRDIGKLIIKGRFFALRTLPLALPQSRRVRVGGRVATKWLVKVTSSLKPARWHILVSFFTSKYHTKQLNRCPNPSTSRVVNYSWLSACQGGIEPFEDHPTTHGHRISLRHKLQQKQSRDLSTPMPG